MSNPYENFLPKNEAGVGASPTTDKPAIAHDWPAPPVPIPPNLFPPPEMRASGGTMPVISQKLLLQGHLSPGDELCRTISVESLHAKYPGKYKTYISTSCPEVWAGNPRVEIVAKDSVIEGAIKIDQTYNSIHRSSQEPHTMLAGYTTDLGISLGIKLTPSVKKPVIYLNPDERQWISMVHEHHTKQPTPYFILSISPKRDYTIKTIPQKNVQEIVDHLKNRIQFVSIGHMGSMRQPLDGVIDLHGQTDLRMLMRLVAHNDCVGGLGTISLLHWLCVAFDKPDILWNGGREPTSFVSGPDLTHVISSVGLYHCCKPHACWKSRVVPLNDGDEKDKSLCVHPMHDRGLLPVAKCMADISADEVIPVIERLLRLRGL